jgi:uncharacterized protein YutD
MYFKCRKNKIIIATMQDGLYVITHINDGYQDNAFFGQRFHDVVFSVKIIIGSKGTTSELTALEQMNYLL